MATKTTKTTKTKTPAPTEEELTEIYWRNPWGLVWDMPLPARTEDRLDDVPMIQVQCFWRWLKNLDYNDGRVTKINTPGANSHAVICAQIRAMYHDLRPREVRGYLKKEVKVVDPDADWWEAHVAAERAAGRDPFAAKPRTATGGGGGAAAAAAFSPAEVAEANRLAEAAAARVAAGDDDEDDDEDQDNDSEDDE
jgi:hypothetical protein